MAKISQLQQSLKEQQNKMNNDIYEIYKETSKDIKQSSIDSWQNMLKEIAKNTQQVELKMTKELNKNLENIDFELQQMREKKARIELGLNMSIGLILGIAITLGAYWSISPTVLPSYLKIAETETEIAIAYPQTGITYTVFEEDETKGKFVIQKKAN